MKSNIVVRPTQNTEQDTVYQLIKLAFETADHRDGDEQDYAQGLRQSENYIPALDLVAEMDGKLIGHILFTKVYIKQTNGDRYEGLLVAPLSVLLEHRNQKVGSLLMKEGLRIAASLGYSSAFLLGDPNYYQRFGYQPTASYGITHESFPPENLMVKRLSDNALDGITGTIEI